MYEELINLLRRCGKQKCKNCEYEHELGCVTKMNEKAADAIEHMQKTILRLENELGVYDDLPMVDQSMALSKTEKTTRWIPVTERLPRMWEEVMLRFPNNQAVGFHDGDSGWAVFSGDNLYTYVAPEEVHPTHWKPNEE